MSESKQIPVNRRLVGIIALSCVTGAVVLWLVRRDQEMLAAALGRVGLLMWAFWLALPARGRAAAWANISPLTLIGALLAILIVARYPRLLIPLVPIIAAIVVIGLFLRPRKKRRRTPRSTVSGPPKPH